MLSRAPRGACELKSDLRVRIYRGAQAVNSNMVYKLFMHIVYTNYASTSP